MLYGWCPRWIFFSLCEARRILRILRGFPGHDEASKDLGRTHNGPRTNLDELRMNPGIRPLAIRFFGSVPLEGMVGALCVFICYHILTPLLAKSSADYCRDPGV